MKKSTLDQFEMSQRKENIWVVVGSIVNFHNKYHNLTFEILMFARFSPIYFDTLIPPQSELFFSSLKLSRGRIFLAMACFLWKWVFVFQIILKVILLLVFLWCLPRTDGYTWNVASFFFFFGGGVATRPKGLLLSLFTGPDLF